MTFSAKEVPLKGKQIWSILAIVDVNDFLVLCVDVEVRQEALCTVCVCVCVCDLCGLPTRVRIHVTGKRASMRHPGLIQRGV